MKVFFRQFHDFVMKMEKFETDSKWRCLKEEAYSRVGVGLKKNILLWSRNRNSPISILFILLLSKNQHYSPALVIIFFFS